MNSPVHLSAKFDAGESFDVCLPFDRQNGRSAVLTMSGNRTPAIAHRSAATTALKLDLRHPSYFLFFTNI